MGNCAGQNGRAPVIYLAGPYRGNVEHNVRVARYTAAILWNMGFVVLCPHTNSGGMERDVPEDTVLMAGAVELMKRCDMLVVMADTEWEKSAGTMREIEVAKEIGMEIMYFGECTRWKMLKETKGGDVECGCSG